MSQLDSASAAVQNYGVELHYETLPPIDKGRLLDALQKRSADIAPVDGKRDSDLLAFAHRGHTVKVGNKNVPAQAAILLSPKGLDMASAPAILQQSWSWPEAVAVLSKCRATAAVTDIMANRLPPLERLTLFEVVLAAILETYPCLAIHWRPTGQFVSPKGFLDATAEAGGLVYTPGPVNVRLFRVEKEPDAAGQEEYFMDTVGLVPFGLPDLQCHFRGLDTQLVSRVLYNTAIYLFEHGPVIKDGDTVPGPKPEDKWVCRRMRSASLPDRSALDLDPGPPYAAGQRSD